MGVHPVVVMPSFGVHAPEWSASRLPNHKLHMIPNAGRITLVVERAEDVLCGLLAPN